MDVRALALAAVAFTIVNAHVSTNILRIQLWDEEGLTREYITTEPPRHRSKVDLATLDAAMMRDEYEHGMRLARHKVRHKRRRPRQSDDLPWRFHSGASRNVAVFDEDVPWEEIEGRLGASVSDSDSSVREVAPPMTLRQDDEADTNNDNYNRPVSPSILQPHPRKRKNETSDSSEAMIGTAKKKLNVAYIEGVNTGLHDCTCLRNEKALTFRFLINGIPDKKIEIFWDEVLNVVQKYSSE